MADDVKATQSMYIDSLKKSSCRKVVVIHKVGDNHSM